jgi:parallel beta-helix repeat protein
MKKQTLGPVVLMLLAASLFGLDLIPTASVGTLYVGGGGAGNYTTIQEAIDAASDGDTVFVYAGTYNENVVIDKSIALMGQSRANTTIDGQDTGNVVTVKANSVTVSGFTIQDGGSEQHSGSGIDAHGVESLLVQDNSFQNSYYGIRSHQSLDIRIVSNTFHGESWSDVHLDDAYGATISNNEFQGSGVDGWYVDGISILENSFGNGMGILLYSAYQCRIVNNSVPEVGYFSLGACTIEGNNISGGYTGINLWFGYSNVIRRNRIAGGWTGIHMYGSTHNLITDNDIVGNDYGIAMGLNEYEYWAQNVDNVIHHNNFIDNGLWWPHHACDSGFGTQWDDGYPSGGNYWSDYSGLDESSGPDQTEPGSDGIGDTPRHISECPDFPYEYVTPEHHEDRYPLMEPFVAPPTPPSKPLGLTATGGFREVELEWRPPRYDGGSPITNYSIYRGNAPGTGTLLVEVGNVTRYVDTGLEMGKTYYYRVSARNANGEGPRSDELSVTVPSMWRFSVDLIGIPGIENVTVNWTPPGGGGGGSRICGSEGTEDCAREAGTVLAGEMSAETLATVSRELVSLEECMRMHNE